MIVGVALVAAGTAPPLAGYILTQATDDATHMRSYNSGDFGELVSVLPVTPYPSGLPYQKRVLFCVDLGDAPVGGETLLATAEYEVTNDTGYNASLETHVLLTTGCDQTDGGEISESNGENVTPADHHGAVVKVGTINVESGNSRRFVVVVAWSGSTRAVAGDTLRVEQDAGRLTVLRWAA